jgi:hypothetical protein
MPFPVIEYDGARLVGPPSPREPRWEERIWVGRMENQPDLALKATWVYQLNRSTDPRCLMLVTLCRPYEFRLQFAGRDNEEAEVRDRHGQVAGALPAWLGTRDATGAPCGTFAAKARRVEIDGYAEVRIRLATDTYVLRVGWSDTPDPLVNRRSPTLRPRPLTRAQLWDLTHWTVGELDFFIIDIAAQHASRWPLTPKEMNDIHGLVKASDILGGRGIGVDRAATRTEMIEKLNEQRASHGELPIGRGGLSGLLQWANRDLLVDGRGVNTIRGLDPRLFDAVAGIVRELQSRRVV